MDPELALAARITQEEAQGQQQQQQQPQGSPAKALAERIVNTIPDRLNKTSCNRKRLCHERYFSAVPKDILDLDDPKIMSKVAARYPCVLEEQNRGDDAAKVQYAEDKKTPICSFFYTFSLLPPGQIRGKRKERTEENFQRHKSCSEVFETNTSLTIL